MTYTYILNTPEGQVVVFPGSMHPSTGKASVIYVWIQSWPCKLIGACVLFTYFQRQTPVYSKQRYLMRVLPSKLN